MSLCREERFRALLDRYEKETGDMLAWRRAEADAAATFLRRFEEAVRNIVRPCLKELTALLQARGLAAYVLDATTYDRDINKVAERLTLVLPDDAQGVAGNSSVEQAGLSLVADAASREVRLESRNIACPEQSHVSYLPRVEEWTREFVEDQLFGALQFVCFVQPNGEVPGGVS